MKRKASQGEIWQKNQWTDLAGMRLFDVYRPYPFASAEIKADLRSRDRVCIEHKALLHSKADIWAYWLAPLQQFIEVPRHTLVNLLLDQERRIRHGAPHHYRGPVGQVRHDGTRAIGTCIYIKDFLKLPGARPA